MATAAVSSSSLQQTLESFLQQRGTDLQQLGHALEHGDLAAAQSAYSALQTLAQNGPFSGAHAFNLTRRQQEFAAIGRDLQSGNLAAAQRAFAELRANRASDPANADGSQPLPPAAVIEISVQGAAAADAAASDSAAASTAAAPSPAPATVATPILTAAPASAAAAASSASSSAPAPVSALEVPPPPEPLVTLALQGGTSDGIEIDLTFANPATPATVSTPATGSAAASPAASTSSASPAATGSGASPTASTAPEIVLNLSPGALAAGSEIDISLSQSANGGELFSLGIGTQTNPSQEQINISLAQNANEQIVLNLLGAGNSAGSAPGTLINISI